MSDVKSVEYREIETIAKAKDATLQATDFSPETAVYVACDDGSRFFWRDAFCETYFHGDTENLWLVVYTEHYGYHLFHYGDIETWAIGNPAKMAETWPQHHEPAPRTFSATVGSRRRENPALAWRRETD